MWSHYRGKEAVLPIHLLKNWSLIGACLCNFFIWMNLMFVIFFCFTVWFRAYLIPFLTFIRISSVYLATWYQAVKGPHSPLYISLTITYRSTLGVSPTRSGIDILPLSLFMAVFAALSGAIVSKIGTLKYILVGVPLLSAVAAYVKLVNQNAYPLNFIHQRPRIHDKRTYT